MFSSVVQHNRSVSDISFIRHFITSVIDRRIISQPKTIHHNQKGVKRDSHIFILYIISFLRYSLYFAKASESAPIVPHVTNPRFRRQSCQSYTSCQYTKISKRSRLLFAYLISPFHPCYSRLTPTALQTPPTIVWRDISQKGEMSCNLKK